MKKLFTVILLCLLVALSVFSQEESERSSRDRKIHQPKYCLFYDNHTMTTCPDVGEGFDIETFVNRIKGCGADMVTFHARCNQGNAYYDTEIGTRHPSLKYDLFGKLVASCQKKDIAVIAYFNGGISSAEGLKHRDWTTLYFDGREYREPRFTPFVRTMCYNTAYRDHLIAMVKEVALKYPVSGFFIDCLDSYPCVCPVCVEDMKQKGIDWEDRAEVIKFSEFSALRLARDIKKELDVINPDFLLYFNGIGFEQQYDLCTHLECECLPNGFWGYEYLPVLSHYIRTLGEKPILNMTARFYDWGDFGSLRPEAAIKYDLLYGLANGMRPNVGGHFHPRYGFENAVMDRLEKIYNELQELEPWYDEAKNITEIAIVAPEPNSNLRNQARNNKSIVGAVRILNELHQQFDVVTKYSDWSKYKVLILPDDVIFDKEISRRIENHLDSGKAVISSGTSGLDVGKTHFVLEKGWGVKYISENSFNPAYYSVLNNFNQGIPQMPLSFYSSGISMEALPGTEVEAYVIKPYYNKKWDGEYAYYYTPPDKSSGLPALTIHKNVAHFSHRIFSGYNEMAPVELRQLLGNVLKRVLPNPVFKAENLPSFANAFVTEQPGGRRIIHILSYIPELRGGNTQMVENPIELHDVKIFIRTDDWVPKKIYTAPGKEILPYTFKNGYIKTDIPFVKGYAMVILE